MGEVGHIYVRDGEAWPCIERLVWLDQNYYTNATTGVKGIVNVSLFVYAPDGGDANTPVYTATIGTDAASGGCLYSALQTDARWRLDALGYNFMWIIPYNAVEAHGGQNYPVEFVFNPHSANITPAGDGQTVKRFIVHVQESISV